MSDINEKLERLAPKIEKEKGPLRLLARFFRDDAPPTWDLIVSADRLHLDNLPDVNYVLGLLVPGLSRAELLTVSRVIIFEARDPQTDEALKEINGRTGYMELRGDFVGFPIRADVIRAGPPGQTAKAPARSRKPRRSAVRQSGARAKAPLRRKAAPTS